MQMLKGWKTVLFGALLVALAALEYLQAADLSSVFPQPWVPMAIGVIVIVLRAVTTGPMGKG